MDRAEAVKIISQVLASFKGNLTEHNIIQEAFRELIKEKNEKTTN